MFMIHYLFENETKINNLFKNASSVLKKNGYLTKICEPNFELFENIKSFKPNIIFAKLSIILRVF